MPPSYFFHLKLELYPTRTPTCAPALSKRHTRADSAGPVFIPPAGADIFKIALPTHRSARWRSYSFKQPDSPPGSDSEAGHRLPTATLATESHGNALLLPERSPNLREPHSPGLSAVKRSNEALARDWRYDTVTIESIDMAATASKAGAKSAVNGLHTKAVYTPTDPKTTDVGYGVVHLYRDVEESPKLEDELARRSLETPRSKHGSFDPDQCTTLCILAVPSWMMPSDLLGFVGDQAREDVSHFRLIRTGRANKYMVLLKFRSPKKAREWQKVNNGRLFSAAEPENCHIVFIQSVEFLNSDSADVQESEHERFPHNTHDPFTPSYGGGDGTRTSNLSTKPRAPPPPNLLELPTCPVCLERMDETTGLLTILCQHVFHCACLEKWRGSGCPVCRYTHSPSYTFPYPRPHSGANDDDDPEPMCSTCASTTNLWICLICGKLGCGRYDSAHAYAHYEATSHCYAMDIATQHVWDYAGDGYVHRLIQSKPTNAQAASHGVVDMPSDARDRHENEAFRAEGGDSVPREKMESMATEYTYLLTSQLEGQRRYFEEQVERAVDKASQASSRAEQAATQAAKVGAALAAGESAQQELRQTFARLEKALEKSEKARVKFEQMARDMTTQLREEKMLNEGLSQRIKAAEEKADAARKEAKDALDAKKELEDMNHDLTMFISSQEKVKELQAQGEEVVDGNAYAPEQRKGKGKGRKK